MVLRSSYVPDGFIISLVLSGRSGREPPIQTSANWLASRRDRYVRPALCPQRRGIIDLLSLDQPQLPRAVSRTDQTVSVVCRTDQTVSAVCRTSELGRVFLGPPHRTCSGRYRWYRPPPSVPRRSSGSAAWWQGLVQSAQAY